MNEASKTSLIVFLVILHKGHGIFEIWEVIVMAIFAFIWVTYD